MLDGLDSSHPYYTALRICNLWEWDSFGIKQVSVFVIVSSLNWLGQTR